MYHTFIGHIKSTIQVNQPRQIMPSLQTLLDDVDDSTLETIELLQNLVRIPSVNTGVMPTGDETRVAEFARDWLVDQDIHAEILGRDPKRGNLIAVVPGDESHTPLMLMSHLDVVPVENLGKWQHEPFSGTIASGRVYGRGSSDCKGLLTAQMMALAILKRNNVHLQKGVRLVSGADEEHGGRWGFGWLASEHPDQLAAEYAVNEGGGIPVEFGGALAYLLGTGEKGRLEIHIRVRGESAHASVPWTGRNSSFALAKVLSNIEKYRSELDTSLPIFKHLGTFAVEDRPSPTNINRIINQLEAQSPQLASILKGLSRMTLTPTMIRGGIKSNSVPETIELTCDVRSLPFQDEEYVKRQLDQVLDGIDGVEYDIDYMSVPNTSPFDTPLADAVKRAQATAIARDDIQWIPSVSTGFTDSRFTRDLGIITYGFSGTHPDDDPMLANVHGTDESIGISSLVSATRAMIALSYDLCCRQ